MHEHELIPFAGAAVLALAEIKAAAAAFDRGEINAGEALDAVIVAVEGYRAEAKPGARTRASRRAGHRCDAPATGGRTPARRWRAAG